MTAPALFRSIAEYTYDWETWHDADGRARWINRAVERITGYQVEECLALTGYPLALAHDEDRGTLARVLDDALAGGSGNDVEFRVRRKDGELRWVAISWQALRDERRRRGYRTSIRDIEQRKQIEAELHVMRRRAEAAVQARTHLLANVSHELRSPVHTIAGFTELLLDSELSAEQRHYLELIARECSGMVRHVEDLLQLAAIEAGGARLSPRAFELRALVQGVIEAAHGRGLLQVELPAEAWLLGDPLRIGQVLRNLVDNALKFTSEGEVRVKATVRRRKDVELTVSDTGSGIDPAQVERLLAPFERATDSRQGVGLGLSIVQRLVAAMRGSLQIEGEPGVGTTVRVWLPLATARPVSKRRPAPRAHKRTHGTVLVVDDSAPARELLTVLLSRAGYRVHEAASGKEAVTRFAECPCELVLLDYQMPDADGIETALALRRLAASGERKPRIFLLTANVLARAQVAERGAAIDGILEKPISRATLLSLLTHHEQGLDARVIADLREVRTNEGTLFDRLLATTCDEMGRELRTLARAAKGRDRAELARSAHRIAGHAGMIGARAVAERARKLEDASARGRFDTLLSRVRDLRRAWTAAERALRTAT